MAHTCTPDRPLREVKDRATNATVATYADDALGRRVPKNVLIPGPFQDAGITRYYYAGDRIVEERDAADTVRAFWTYGQYVDEPLTMDRLVAVPASQPTSQPASQPESQPESQPADPPPVAEPLPAGRYYYHRNRLYNVAALTNAAGAVVERYQYGAYGQATTFDAAYGAPAPASRAGNPFTFTGRELDPETMLMHYRARAYDPAQGQFRQRDPLVYVDGMGVYVYVGNAVTWLTDPSGQLGVTSQPGKASSQPSLVTYRQVTYDDFLGSVPNDADAKFNAMIYVGIDSAPPSEDSVKATVKGAYKNKDECWAVAVKTAGKFASRPEGNVVDPCELATAQVGPAFRVWVFMVPGLSWMRADRKTPDVLNHEQRHFDIGNMVAAEAQEDIKSYVGAGCGVKTQTDTGRELDSKAHARKSLWIRGQGRVADARTESKKTNELYDQEAYADPNAEPGGQQRWNEALEKGEKPWK